MIRETTMLKDDAQGWGDAPSPVTGSASRFAGWSPRTSSRDRSSPRVEVEDQANLACPGVFLDEQRGPQQPPLLAVIEQDDHVSGRALVLSSGLCGVSRTTATPEALSPAPGAVCDGIVVGAEQQGFLRRPDFPFPFEPCQDISLGSRRVTGRLDLGLEMKIIEPGDDGLADLIVLGGTRRVRFSSDRLDIPHRPTGRRRRPEGASAGSAEGGSWAMTANTATATPARSANQPGQDR